MAPLPLHPAIVHIPLGLAFVMPLLALGLTWATWRAHRPRRAFAVLVALQLLVGLAGVRGRHERAKTGLLRAKRDPRMGSI